MDEVVVKAHVRKDRPQNTMATISARTFSVEEARRYAGGIDDPARMASAFAGVTTGDMQDNAIAIRGNAPKGILWRLEGVEIPNPNHFAGANVVGGGFVTVFSSQMLTNSDFYTGAFPSQYGNALAGVFDMKLRTGNNQQREYAFQAGMLGIDFSAEGPFVKEKRASYLFNYRYSTFAIISPLLPTQQVPKYQDLSFKLNFPTKKAGTFSLWAIGAIDRNTEPESTDSTEWVTEWDKVHHELGIDMGAVGINNKIIIGNNSYCHTSLVVTASNTFYNEQKLDDKLILRPNEYIDNLTGKFIFSSFINHKFSAKHTNRTGFIANRLFYDMNFKTRTTDSDYQSFRSYVEEDGSDYLFQAYSQSKFTPTENLELTAGLHSLYFNLNGNFTLEPRFGLRWSFTPGHTISFGYGNHSQLEELSIYLADNPLSSAERYPNKDLEPAKAHHFILGYDVRLAENLRLKIEPYYQYLYDIPVIQDSSYSFVNYVKAWFFNDPLVNEGTGTNMGIDITLERFLKNGFYYLITASVFDSKYVGGDGIERDTRYNKRFVGNLLFGKEFKVGRNGQNNILGINGRFITLGGERLHQIDTQASLAAKEVIYDYSHAFERQAPTRFHFDFTVTYRRNKAKYSGIWALQIKNMLGSMDYYGYKYSYKENDLIEDKVRIVVPSISYKIEF